MKGIGLHYCGGCKLIHTGQVGRLESLSEVVAANFGFYSHKGINPIGFKVNPNQHILNLITFAKFAFQMHIFQVDMNFQGDIIQPCTVICHCPLIIVGLRQRTKNRIMTRAVSFDTEIPGLKFLCCLIM